MFHSILAVQCLVNPVFRSYLIVILIYIFDFTFHHFVLEFSKNFRLAVLENCINVSYFLLNIFHCLSQILFIFYLNNNFLFYILPIITNYETKLNNFKTVKLLLRYYFIVIIYCYQILPNSTLHQILLLLKYFHLLYFLPK